MSQKVGSGIGAGGDVSASEGAEMTGRDAAEQNINLSIAPPTDDAWRRWMTEMVYGIAADTSTACTTLSAIMPRIDHHDEILRGNGRGEREGLVSRVRDAWRWMPFLIMGVILSLALDLLILFGLIQAGVF
ncbi:MAG: hypothetical protein ACYTEQ_21090 [Planctomycetota bacterium]|jgi:hypothetical protein